MDENEPDCSAKSRAAHWKNGIEWHVFYSFRTRPLIQIKTNRTVAYHPIPFHPLRCCPLYHPPRPHRHASAILPTKSRLKLNRARGRIIFLDRRRLLRFGPRLENDNQLDRAYPLQHLSSPSLPFQLWQPSPCPCNARWVLEFERTTIILLPTW